MQFSSDKIYSHSNGNLLSEHLFAVATTMWLRAKEKKELAFLLGVVHDFGKLTSFFQNEKIRNIDSFKEKSNHSLISIYFCIWLLKQKPFCEYFEKTDALIALFVVNHHSSLRDYRDMLTKICSYKDTFKKELQPQVKNILERLETCKQVFGKEIFGLFNKIENFPEWLKVAIVQVDIENFLNSDFCENSCNRIIELKTEFDGFDVIEKIKLSFYIRNLYSLLIYADRKMAKKLPESLENELGERNFLIPEKIIIQSLPSDENQKTKYRSDFFGVVDKNCEKDSKIYTLSAPTGAGKTFAGVNAALKLLYKHKKKKIVYALPMTNIIEQVHSVLTKVLKKNISDFEQNEFYYLLKHHYMAEYGTSESVDIGKTLDFVENWESNFVITTFVQFFNALGSNSPSFLVRLPKLQDSVIILDEPQVLNPNHWFAIKRFLEYLTNDLGSIVILMTATKPPLFDDGEFIELSKEMDFKTHLEKNGRHKIVSDFSREIYLDNFIDFLFEKNIFEKKSALVVLNTIESAKTIYKKAKEDKRLEGFNIFHLSTNLLPIHRKKVIEKIQELLLNPNEKVLLVSTQTVEAGVDLDFEVGFRDLAPLPSIVQTAGRINRHGHREMETLYVGSVKKDENQKEYLGEYVYDSEFLRFTKNILDVELLEEQFEEKTERYFNNVKRYVQNKAKEIDAKIGTLDFENFSMEFRIIDDKDSTPVFIEYDNEAKAIRQNIEELKNERQEADSYEESFKLKQLEDYERKKMYKYIINVRSKIIKLTENEWYYLGNNDSYYFDENSCHGTGIETFELERFY